VPTTPCPDDEIVLGVAPSATAYWAGIEVLHTVRGHETWEVGVMNVQAGNRRPWRVRATRGGRWDYVPGQDGVTWAGKGNEDDSSGDEQPRPASAPPQPEPPMPPMQEVLEEIEETLEELEEELLEEGLQPEEEVVAEIEEVEVKADTEEDLCGCQAEEKEEEEEAAPAASSSSVVARRRPKRAASKPKSKPRSRSPPRSGSPAFGGLTVECWSRPGEDAMQRLDRVMEEFLEKLREAKVVIPSNLRRLGPCEEPLHPNCVLYSFGTRRLHIQVREGDNGQLTLVVRCGGGFLDFVAFVRRHGSLEELKLQRRVDATGRERIQLVSVMTNRKHVVRDDSTL